MNVTFRQLRLIQALADTGSVGAAARAMHVTQPTASMQLKEMADAVGLPLYDLISRKITLTEAGHELAQTARAIAGEWESFEQKIDAMKGLTRGKLRISVVSTAKYFIPRMLGSFCAHHPDIDIALEVLNRDGVVSRLRNNLDDLYIMSQPPGDLDLSDQVFMPNPLLVIAPSTHRFSKRRKLALHDLQQDRFILRERGSGTRMTVEKHFEKSRFKPNTLLELGSNEAIKESVAAGLGVAIVSSHALQNQLSGAGVNVLRVAGFPLESKWHVVHPRAKKLTPIAAVFLHYLLHQAAE
jgi:DNA-binding transcriptional LysR family regulator